MTGDRAPSEDELAAALGSTRPRWDELVDAVCAEHPKLRREWKYYGAKHGWQLKLLDGKRAALYLIPKQGGFVAALALNDEQLAAARASELPAALVREIESAKRAPEGRPARVNVRTKSDVAIVCRLVASKLRR